VPIILIIFATADGDIETGGDGVVRRGTFMGGGNLPSSA